jgi:hypothetical protein
MSDERKEASLLPMILGVSAIGIALVLGGVYIFSRYLVKQTGQAASTLPRRSHEVAPTIESMDRGTMYPGAVRTDDASGKIAVELPVHGSYQVITGNYFTHDSLDEAIAYYRHFFKGQATERLEPGGARWFQKIDSDERVVVLQQDPNDHDRLNIHLAVIFEED